MTTRTVELDGSRIKVSNDASRIIGDFLEYALSLQYISQRPPAEELAELFAPGGKGMALPDTFGASRAFDADDLPYGFDWDALAGQGIREPWVLSRHRWGAGMESAVVDGEEVRHLLQRALALRSSRT